MNCTASPPWFGPCTSNTQWKAPFCILDGLLMPTIVLVLLMWWMKARMLLSYRVIAGWQSISLILYSTVLSTTTSFQTAFGLLSLGKSNGPFLQSTFSPSPTFLLPTITLIIAFLSFLALFYSPYGRFIKQPQSYLQYIKENAYRCFLSIYMFGSRLMLFWVGGWISNGMAGGVASYIILSFIGLIVVGVIGKTFYDYHNGLLSGQTLYEPHLHLYCILSPLSMFGLQLATVTYLPILIYLLPLGLLLLILLLTPSSPIFTKEHGMFYIVQGGMAAAAVLLYIVGSGTTFIIAAVGYIGWIVVVVEASYVYYSGFTRNTQVYPQKEEEEQNQKVRPANILKIQQNSKPKGAYF